MATVAHALAASPAAPSPSGVKTRAARSGKGPKVVVVGAGAFGGWTALHLLRARAKVTLLVRAADDPGLAAGARARIAGTPGVGPGRAYVQLVA